MKCKWWQNVEVKTTSKNENNKFDGGNMMASGGAIFDNRYPYCDNINKVRCH